MCKERYYKFHMFVPQILVLPDVHVLVVYKNHYRIISQMLEFELYYNNYYCNKLTSIKLIINYMIYKHSECWFGNNDKEDLLNH